MTLKYVYDANLFVCPFCFDAWYIENDELKYNWKKDKRFSIYASGDKTNPEYAK